METTAIFLADILFLAILVFTISLDRRAVKQGERQRRDMARLSERIWQLRREVSELRDDMDNELCAEAHIASSAKSREDALAKIREGEEERRFNEAVANILGYGLNAQSAAEDDR